MGAWAKRQRARDVELDSGDEDALRLVAGDWVNRIAFSGVPGRLLQNIEPDYLAEGLGVDGCHEGREVRELAAMTICP